MAIFRRLQKIWQNFRALKSVENLTKKQILHLSASKRWPDWRQWKQVGFLLSAMEKKIVGAALIIAGLSMITLVGWLTLSHRSEIPAIGGEYTEGLVGAPQFINPLYSSASDVDSDLTKLIYSGLFQWSESGLIPDLAESYTVSDDQKTYTIKIRSNAKWHNGDPVRSSDVLFTVQSIQNPAYHSPLASSFRGVQISEVDEQTVQFVLEEPFAPFLSTLTIGILPSNLWAEIPPKNIPLTSLNLSPIGSGPYKFDKYILEEKSGKILSFNLIRFNDYYGQPAKIEKMSFKFYSDIASAAAALENQNIEGLSFVPSHLVSEIQKNHSINLLHPNMPQEVVLFFNQETQPLLKNYDLRQALALTINKKEIVDQVLNGNGIVIEAPILSGLIGFYPEVKKIEQDTAAALALIDKTDYSETSPDGFRAKKIKKIENEETVDSLEELTLTLTTINQPEFIKTAEIIATQAKIVGIKIQIETSEPSDFYSNIIKPRAYQMLLTAAQLGIDPDPYPFWHSSQTKDPGLNLSLYANKKVDNLLEKARVTNNVDERAVAYKEFQDIIAEDLPAIFLYQPTYAYAISNKIKNISLNSIHSPADRFQHVINWYIKTKQVFK